MNTENNNNINLGNNASNINNALDSGDVKSQIGDNLKDYNTPVLQEVNNSTGPTIVVQKVKNKATPFFLIIILLLFGACYYMYDKSNKTIQYYEHQYSPINTKKAVTLDNNSFLVKNLYSKVHTSVEEDLADSNLDNSMKLYLAFRNIDNHLIYPTGGGCNLFNNSTMQNISCNDNTDFLPKAFKIETLTNSINELFGETSGVSLSNIQLGISCFGGYQYIPDRGEYVEGLCTAKRNVIYEAKKEIVKAVSTENKIMIEEKVVYSNPTGGAIPNELVSGIYHHNFRLDKNYDYIYEGKELVEKRG